LKPIIEVMGKHHAVAILFAFFGFYFFHCAEAKAETTYSSAPPAHFYLYQDQIQSSHASHSKAFADGLELSKFFPWAFTVPTTFEFSFESRALPEGIRTTQSCAAKEFYIRTGLSPPNRFA
jgi:hypothetical protein